MIPKDERRFIEAPPAPYNWRDKANCAGLTPAETERVFYPTNGLVTNEARLLCSICPVTRQCDEFARGMRIRWGIWAGRNREAS